VKTEKSCESLKREDGLSRELLLSTKEREEHTLRKHSMAIKRRLSTDRNSRLGEPDGGIRRIRDLKAERPGG
jgi:hypothetical protein